MARGIEGRDIFSTGDDRRRFLSLLSSGLKRTGFACYAWALMKNHYHLLLRSSELHLSELMRPLNSAYAQSYSKVHNRRGYLFQDRYKSLVTQDQGYVEQLVRYVHANPLRAGVCKSIRELDSYPWTGHAVLMGNRTAEFQDTWTVLQRFGKSIAEGRKGYAAFIAEALNPAAQEILPAIRKGNSDRDPKAPGSYVLGDLDFVRGVLRRDRENRLRLGRCRLDGVSIDEVAAKFANAAGIPVEDLQRRGRSNHRGMCRKLFAYVCHRYYNYSTVEIARFLDCTQPPVSIAIRHAEQIVNDPNIAKILIKIRP